MAKDLRRWDKKQSDTYLTNYKVFGFNLCYTIELESKHCIHKSPMEKYIKPDKAAITYRSVLMLLCKVIVLFILEFGSQIFGSAYSALKSLNPISEWRTHNLHQNIQAPPPPTNHNAHLRIDHTHLTHGYLMNNPLDPIPECKRMQNNTENQTCL